VKTGNHDRAFICDNKKERVREAAQEGASNVFKDGGKLPGMVAHPFDEGVNRLAETSA
jgi:hypothetical protein